MASVSPLEVWESFHPRMRAFVRSRIRDPQDAEDVLQEIYIKLHTRADSLQDTQRLSAWLFQIARNTIIDHYRKQRTNISINDVEIPFDDETQSGDDPARLLAAGLSDMLHCLPENYRQAVHLAELEGLNQSEVAQQLGLSLSGAKSRVQRGRVLLREALLDCCHFEFDRRGHVIDYYPRCCPRCCA
jgi:RNA polymerase sigma-70 factor (ECF subfamily)